MTRPNRKSPIGRFAAAGRRKLREKDGFTLIEVMVALAILGLSLAVLLAIFSQSLARVRSRDHAQAARQLAQSLLARAMASDSASIGQTRGTTSHGLAWRLQIAPYGSDDASNAIHAARISASVSWPGISHWQAINLTTLRLLPPAKDSP